MAKKKDKRQLNDSENINISDDASVVNDNKSNATQYIGRDGIIEQLQIKKALEILNKYKSGKKNLENRIIENEQWWKLRHWEQMKKNGNNTNKPEPASAWLFNSLLNKHADAMDNFPAPNVLAREESDQETAEVLSKVLPVLIEQSDYEETYSQKWWRKLKTGTGVTGVFWDNEKHNGLGDITIKNFDILNLYWEPGITDIQDSKNFFSIETVDNEILKEQYPFLEDTLKNSSFDIAKYIYDDAVDASDKSVVVDWYYKITKDNKKILHYCKFVNDEVIYASQNDPEYSERGFYDHGLYPFDFDVLFQAEGTPAGFGYIDTMKDTQMYIDKLNQGVLTNALANVTPRYFFRGDGGVNEDEFVDFTKPIVHVNNLNDDSIKKIEYATLPSIYVSILQMKIDELKETSGNRDWSQGGTASGVTSGNAIAALQEAGSKLSRDMIKASYRSFKRLCVLILENIRQFYDETRTFRIVGDFGDVNFVEFNNSQIAPQNQGESFGVDLGARLPIFDIDVRVQKNNPFSREAQNTLALNFLNSGMFSPQLADQSLATLEMMDFENISKVKQIIARNGTMYEQLMQLQQQMQQMAQVIDMQNGTNIIDPVAMQGEDLDKKGKAKMRGTEETITNSLGATVNKSSSQTRLENDRRIASNRTNVSGN